MIRTRRFASAAVIVLLAASLTGCVTAGVFNTATLTDVQLSQSNYEVVATNVQGRAEAGYVFGISGSVAQQLQTVAIARVSGSEQLYGDALKDLWTSFEAEHGSPEGRNLALINVRYDVVEFTD